MKSKICAVLVAAISTFIALGQTNSTVEYRMVKNVTYDVSKPPFILVTIPAGTALLNSAAIHYAPNQAPDLPIILKRAVFQIPAIYDSNTGNPVVMTISDFPYSPLHFKRGTITTKFAIARIASSSENGLVTKEAIVLRLFQASPATTNYDAMGVMKITPAKPNFIYGTPVQSAN